MDHPDLDLWLPDPAIRVVHRREADASPDDLWAASSAVRLDETRSLGKLVRWRIPDTPMDQTYRAMFERPPFHVLGEGERWSASALVGPIWTLRRDYRAVPSADAFREWDEGGVVRVLFAHWIEETGRGKRSAIVSESRVKATDRFSSLRLKALWAAVRPFERFIGSEPLTLAVQRAAGSRSRSPARPAR